MGNQIRFYRKHKPSLFKQFYPSETIMRTDEILMYSVGKIKNYGPSEQKMTGKDLYDYHSKRYTSPLIAPYIHKTIEEFNFSVEYQEDLRQKAGQVAYYS